MNVFCDKVECVLVAVKLLMLEFGDCRHSFYFDKNKKKQ